MTSQKPDKASHRVATSDDIEVATYLEIAQGDKTKAAPSPVSSQPAASPAGRTAKPETILILDFGSQYSRLIARRVREANVYCEIIPHTAGPATLRSQNVMGIILSGGPASVYEAGAPQAPGWVFDAGVPVLGICYGMQLLAHQLGGKVAPGAAREYGFATINKQEGDNPLLSGLDSAVPVWMSHGDRIDIMPPGFRALAHSENSPVAVMGNGRGLYGIQFHPEVAHTPQGAEIIRNFLYRICGCSASWTPTNFVTDAVTRIQGQVGPDGRVICALSGGVDSAVAAVLIHQAIGDRLTCIFVNNGLMRRGEPERVRDMFARNIGLKLVYVDASERFLASLKGVTDPEVKRKRIGAEFINVFEEQANALGKVDFLAQGTLYPDVIESATSESKAAHKIKTHHNVGGLPEHMKLRLIEPLRFLFKDEVRLAGRELGMPSEVLNRQPFPGPGLAIRVIGEITHERLEILRAADWIVIDEIKRDNLYDKLWQSFAVLTDTRSVGVMGDLRTYSYVVAIRAVTSNDAMTADWARLPYETLARISSRIVNEVAGVNRVVYDVTSKPPGTIEWE
ncbi:MAG: glutamine-hydrolyzing GMP synthase [Dehalococcoidia bacterium]|nr:glutamine-hydrolyzing GMP synthase [Dehalococcoidia bacterium]MSQ34770.1 glutamine-hydrolyzing GMP synthase [Dehalococcoidia bacterium]